MKCNAIYSNNEPTKWMIDGKSVTKEEWDRIIPSKPIGAAAVATRPGAWPIYSDAASVHPSQIDEAKEIARKQGVPTEFLPDGRAILTDQNHRRRYLKIRGLYDRNGGYGDPSPDNI